jgi:hypothetical protein
MVESRVTKEKKSAGKKDCGRYFCCAAISQNHQDYSASNYQRKHTGVNPTTPGRCYIRANFSKSLAYWHAHRPTLKELLPVEPKGAATKLQ